MGFIYMLYILFIWSTYQRHLIESNAQNTLCSPETNATGNITNYNSTTNETTSDSFPVTSFITIGVYFGFSSSVAAYFYYIKRKEEKQKEVEKSMTDVHSDGIDLVEPPKPTVDVYVTAVPEVVVVEPLSSSSENLEDVSNKNDHTGDVPEIVVTDTEGDDDSDFNFEIATSGVEIHANNSYFPEIENTDSTHNFSYLTVKSGNKNREIASILDNDVFDSAIVSISGKSDNNTENNIISTSDAHVPEIIKNEIRTSYDSSNTTEGEINVGFDTDDIKDIQDSALNNTYDDSGLVTGADGEIHFNKIHANVEEREGRSDSSSTDGTSVDTLMTDTN